MYLKMGIGDWGLGIAPIPIPNPQSPMIDNNFYDKIKIIYYYIKVKAYYY